ncbi:MAG TPA: TIGR03118 family protein, partial [Chthoniobacterales bacterium]
ADPTNKNTPTGTPTGTIANGSQTDFLLVPGQPALFLFSTIDGTIAGWNPAVGVAQGAASPSTHAVTVVKTSDGSSYTGLTSAFIDGRRYLYAANFTKGRVDVYDNAFHLVTLSKGHFNEDSSDDEGRSSENSFVDEDLPRFYVPFNVQAIGNDIVVTYVLHEEGSRFETDGPGLGFVDIYSSTGQLLKRLEHGDWLNAPWGVALAPLDFGRFSHDLLIGQFAGGGDSQSSGFIAAYDLATGKFDGLLQDASGKPLAINGIWALSPGNVSPNNSDAAAAPAAEVYFTAGPNHGSGGLVGYLTTVSSELTKGNDQ